METLDERLAVREVGARHGRDDSVVASGHGARIRVREDTTALWSGRDETLGGKEPRGVGSCA